MANAREHVIEAPELIAIDRKTMPPVGNREGFWTEVADGFRVVFSFETQPDSKIGFCRHLSVSVSDPGRFPAPAAMDIIMSHLEFRNRIFPKPVEVPEGFWLVNDGRAINVIETVGN